MWNELHQSWVTWIIAELIIHKCAPLIFQDLNFVIERKERYFVAFEIDQRLGYWIVAEFIIHGSVLIAFEIQILRLDRCRSGMEQGIIQECAPVGVEVASFPNWTTVTLLLLKRINVWLLETWPMIYLHSSWWEVTSLVNQLQSLFPILSFIQTSARLVWIISLACNFMASKSSTTRVNGADRRSFTLIDLSPRVDHDFEFELRWFMWEVSSAETYFPTEIGFLFFLLFFCLFVWKPGCIYRLELLFVFRPANLPDK